MSALCAPADPTATEELVFFLQYVGSDYGVAVRNEKVVDPAEYRQAIDLTEQILERYEELRPRGAALSDLKRLRELVRKRASWDAVRSLSRELVPRVADELDVVAYPAETPDLARGRGIYAENCAPCHGVEGGGDGPASLAMTPRPTSFRDLRIALLSPHQVYNAENFGLSGTGMPAYRGALPPRDLWDVAFFVMTLREGFDPRPPVESVPLSLREVAAFSDEELLKRLRLSRPGAQVAELDYYRGQFARAAPREAAGPAADGDSGLAVAARLERAFASVAEQVFPSVVGVSVYEPQVAPQPPPSGKPAPEGWREGDLEDRLYPGLHRVRAGTGFLVSGEGDILTCAHFLLHPGPAPDSGVVDVELAGNIHCRARVVGIEPTIDLAVLRIVPPVPVRAATIGNSDDVRVGHWAIAIGDPPGADRTFAPGTIAARPERECYQEHRTSTWLQSSAAIEPAGFGGPLVNLRGEVVGLTIPGASAAALGPSSLPVNALPINLAMTIYHALRVKESERSPWIGISVLELSARLRAKARTAPLTGIYIDDVFTPSPASRTGIRVGDVLTRMDDHPILGVSDFQTWLYLLGIDASVTLEIVREGATLRKVVTIESRPESALTR